jgi:hypothetical protein
MFKIYEETTYTEAVNKIPALQYNWCLVKLCFDAWHDEINKERRQKIKLHEIAGVGENYIGQLCSGKLQHTYKKFGAESNEMLYGKLKGKIKMQGIPAVSNYILMKSIKKPECYDGDAEKWVRKNIRKNEKLNIDNLTIKFKNEAIQYIKNASLKELDNNDHYIKTDLGIIKDYLLGSEEQDCALDEIHIQMVRLLQLMLDINCDMISKMSNGELKNFITYSNVINDRLLAEQLIRGVQETEKKWKKEIIEKNFENQEKDKALLKKTTRN